MFYSKFLAKYNFKLALFFCSIGAGFWFAVGCSILVGGSFVKKLGLWYAVAMCFQKDALVAGFADTETLQDTFMGSCAGMLLLFMHFN